MSAVVLPRIGGREVYRCECGLIQFPTKDGKCRKVSCRLPFVEEEPESLQVFAFTQDPSRFYGIPRTGQVITSVSKNPNVIELEWVPRGGVPLTNTLPHVLKVLRVAHGLSQQQLAKKIGQPRTYVSKIERNVATPLIRTLHRTAAVFGLTVSDVMLMCEAAA